MYDHLHFLLHLILTIHLHQPPSEVLCAFARRPVAAPASSGLVVPKVAVPVTGAANGIAVSAALRNTGAGSFALDMDFTNGAGSPVHWEKRSPSPVVSLVHAEAIEGAVDYPYQVPHIDIRHTHVDPGVPITWWRSVGYSHNGFAVETFMDERAYALAEDQIEGALCLV